MTTVSSWAPSFIRITGLGLFHFPAWYAEQHRALRASTDWRWPATKEGQEKALVEVLKATPARPA